MNDKKVAEKAVQLSPVSTHTIFYHQTIADHLALNPTDHKCLLYLFEGRKTMGQLSQLTGLTLGAQTASIERLEKAGFVRRVHDDDDRRRVYAEIIPTNIKKIITLFMPLGQAVAKLEATYSPAELHMIHDYMQQTARILREETIKLRQKLDKKTPQ